jgi:hypothetical protein
MVVVNSPEVDPPRFWTTSSIGDDVVPIGVEPKSTTEGVTSRSTIGAESSTSIGAASTAASITNLLSPHPANTTTINNHRIR